MAEVTITIRDIVEQGKFSIDISMKQDQPFKMNPDEKDTEKHTLAQIVGVAMEMSCRKSTTCRVHF
jgi:hypothetical protein